jgi:HPr kinase/phosphorylase
MPIKLKELLSEDVSLMMSLTLETGEAGLDHKLTSARIQKPGLLLTGHLEELHSERMQVFGAAEIGYLNSIGAIKLDRSLKLLERTDIPAIIVTRGLDVPSLLLKYAKKKNIPLFKTPLTSSILIQRMLTYLEEKLAPEITMHGVAVDVLGIGIIITGKSGIGKSECALDLITRGHRLVADDAVIIRRRYPSTLFGLASDIISYHMEVRGLGIVNVKDIFGITAIRKRKQLDMIVDLVEWNPEGDYERLGFDESTQNILGVELPQLKIPVSPGRSVATIVEVAARNRILKIMGYDSSKVFEELHTSLMKSKAKV